MLEFAIYLFCYFEIVLSTIDIHTIIIFIKEALVVCVVSVRLCSNTAAHHGSRRCCHCHLCSCVRCHRDVVHEETVNFVAPFVISLIIVIIIHEFHRVASLE